MPHTGTTTLCSGLKAGSPPAALGQGRGVELGLCGPTQTQAGEDPTLPAPQPTVPHRATLTHSWDFKDITICSSTMNMQAVQIPIQKMDSLSNSLQPQRQSYQTIMAPKLNDHIGWLGMSWITSKSSLCCGCSELNFTSGRWQVSVLYSLNIPK